MKVITGKMKDITHRRHTLEDLYLIHARIQIAKGIATPARCTWKVFEDGTFVFSIPIEGEEDNVR